MTLALVLAALLAVACVVVRRAAVPARAGCRGRPLAGLDAAERRRLELLERRDRALAALKELEFDHRTGKVSDEDYRALVGGAATRRRGRAAGARPRIGKGRPAGERN